MAAKLAVGLTSLLGVKLYHPVEANEVFIQLPEPVIEGLFADGFQFYRWEPGEQVSIVRLVTAFNTRVEDVTAFLEAAQSYKT
ncbi:MAG: hypothetical protein NVSMB70_10440 [Chamaesiphon sp.]